jgi:hypothetical protein
MAEALEIKVVSAGENALPAVESPAHPPGRAITVVIEQSLQLLTQCVQAFESFERREGAGVG